jgi:hypothetical protein
MRVGATAAYRSDGTMTPRHETPIPDESTAMTIRDSIIELDSRTTDGVEVRLLWHRVENRVTVTARDLRSGEVLEGCGARR